MALQVTLDGVDITSALNAQHPLPTTTGAGVYPDRSKDKYWDLLEVVAKTPALKNVFLKGGVHNLQITDTLGTSYSVRVLVNSKFSARNR